MTLAVTTYGQSTPYHPCHWHRGTCMVREYINKFLVRLWANDRFERSKKLKLTHWIRWKLENEETVELHRLRGDYKAEARHRGHNVSGKLNGNLEATLRALEHMRAIDWDRNTGRIVWKGYGMPPLQLAPPSSPRPPTQWCPHGNLLYGRPVQGRWISRSCRTCRGVTLFHATSPKGPEFDVTASPPTGNP
jgi:hypothetical protein